MTVVDKLLEWLGQWDKFDQFETALGDWEEAPNDSATRFLAIMLETGPRPGVVERFNNVRLYVTSQRNAQDIAGAKWEAYELASSLESYIVENPKSSCFENVVLLAGIIGPIMTTQGRACYEINIQLTT